MSEGETVADQPLVGICMGSDSDWPTMQAAADALDEFNVAYEVNVVSAHRMPHEMVDYGATATARGLRVIIAGAGGAALLSHQAHTAVGEAQRRQRVNLPHLAPAALWVGGGRCCGAGGGGHHWRTQE